MVISLANISGAVTSNVYRGQDKPWFTLGHGIVLLYIGIALFSSIALKFFLDRENARRDRGDRDELIAGVNDQTVSSLSIRHSLELQLNDSVFTVHVNEG